MGGIKGKFREAKHKRIKTPLIKITKKPKAKPTEKKIDRSKKIGWLKKMREGAKTWENKDCIFCKIITKEVPSHVIYEDDYTIVVMDIFPTTIGQSVVIVKKHVDYLFDLSEVSYTKSMQVAKKIINATDKAFKTIKTCMLVEGFEVPHAHIKIYPCYEEHFSLKLLENKPTDADFKAQAEKIKANLESNH